MHKLITYLSSELTDCLLHTEDILADAAQNRIVDAEKLRLQNARKLAEEVIENIDKALK